MCGIVGVFNREGVFPLESILFLFEEAEKRGQDGFGFSITEGFTHNWKYTGKYSLHKLEVSQVVKSCSKGSVILANCRAQPEMEVSSSGKNSIQPICKDGIVVVHNGSVSNFIVDELSDIGYQSEIDSESIINAYIRFSGNMKKTMEYLVGGFAFILLDTHYRRLFCVNDYKPLAIGYVKGYGLLIHSELSAIGSVVEMITDCKRCGTNLWEDFYYHWQFPGYSIREIDLDSGMERLYRFRPRFHHPVWNSLTDGKGVKFIVLASGGIDSSLTAWVLYRLGYDVTLLHFDYGQKGEDAERWAVQRLSEVSGMKLQTINLRGIFSGDSSCLIDKSIEIKTGTDEYLKSTDAWCSNRNQLFLSIATTLAEQIILRENLEKVYIEAGLYNLSESGIYPDNSELFTKTFFENVEYSTITGKRIQSLGIMRNIMKSEEWILGEALGFPFQYTVSCDQPILDGNVVYLCRQCGSTLLSIWGAEMAGIEDPRLFYDREFGSEVMKKRFSGKTKSISVSDVVRRLEMSNGDKNTLLSLVKEG